MRSRYKKIRLGYNAMKPEDAHVLLNTTGMMMHFFIHIEKNAFPMMLCTTHD